MVVVRKITKTTIIELSLLKRQFRKENTVVVVREIIITMTITTTIIETITMTITTTITETITMTITTIIAIIVAEDMDMDTTTITAKSFVVLIKRRQTGNKLANEMANEMLLQSNLFSSNIYTYLFLHSVI